MRARILSLVSLSLVLPACGAFGPRELPARSSPTPAIADGSVTRDDVVDAVGSEPAWWDASTRRVVRLRDGAVSPVQDVAIPVPAVVRVLEDDTILAQDADTLTVYPAGTEPYEIPLSTTETAFDGISEDDIWYVEWALGTGDGYRLCHVLPAGPDCVTQVPNVGGYSPALGVAPDGTVYVTDRDRGLYHWTGTELGEVTRPAGTGDFITGFRHGDGPGLLAIAYVGVYAIDDGAIRIVFDDLVNGVTGSPDAFVVAQYDSESVKVDPGRSDSFLRSCERRMIWSQSIFTEVTSAGERELGHEDCDLDHPETTVGCERDLLSLGLDGDDVVLVGSPMRRIER